MENKLGIEDFEELRDEEALHAALREVQLAGRTFRRTFDLDHLCFLNRWLFQDVYAWAGEPRSVPFSKPGSEFAKPMFIREQAHALFRRLRDENRLRDIERARLATRIAYYFGELNALHPFREGNGRTQRLFLTHLVALRGLSLDWDGVTAKEMVRISVAIHNGNDVPAVELFSRILKG